MSDILDYAYAGLLHDIGKFYQRTELRSSLTESEKELTPTNRQFGYHTHLHSGYTSRFFQNVLQLNNNLERAASAHHLDGSDVFDSVIRRADHIASALDRQDEQYDYEEEHTKSRYRYITARLNSIFYEIDFGKKRSPAYFPLGRIDDLSLLKENKSIDAKEAAKEYEGLFKQLLDDMDQDHLLIGKPTWYKYHRIYSLLYRYTTLIPASTYETNHPTVSLFDHLKLTSAIASCLALQNSDHFYMFEFDVSGIQKFIYKITEGNETKSRVAKSLRGRSAFVSLLTNAITYTILNAFGLTEANIIFNTGGGGILLLPDLEDTPKRIDNICTLITESLYERFNTDLTFVYAYEKMDEAELEEFKSAKAISLKVKLEAAKTQKFKHMMGPSFTYQSNSDQDLCVMCHEHPQSKDGLCSLCQSIIDLSDYYTSHDAFIVHYDFVNTQDSMFDLGFVGIKMSPKVPKELVNSEQIYYLDSVNGFKCGNVKLLGNLVPKDMNGTSLGFEDIVQLQNPEDGDRKLGILKMDVDNLGAIFAFGLKNREGEGYEVQRSLSKYLTLSRLMEIFFTQQLKKICIELSQRLSMTKQNMFYINYAGGDDLVILGPVYGIVYLALEINRQFKAFVRNENITISGGIHIQRPSEPVRFGIQFADDALESSKHYMMDGKMVKNAMTMMDITVPFSDYQALLDQVETYRTLIRQKRMTRTGFYRIMSQIKDRSLMAYYESVPLIQYSIIRNISDQEVQLMMKRDLTTIDDEQTLRKMVLMMKLVILFTREGS